MSAPRSPGPWAANLPVRSDGALLASHVVDANGSAVAQIVAYDDATTAANARMAAAAPELADALLDLIRATQAKLEKSDALLLEFDLAIIERGLAALEQATGGAA